MVLVDVVRWLGVYDSDGLDQKKSHAQKQQSQSTCTAANLCHGVLLPNPLEMHDEMMQVAIQPRFVQPKRVKSKLMGGPRYH